MNLALDCELTAELERRRRALQQEFGPSLKRYTDMASEMMALNEEIYRRKLKEIYPNAEHTDKAFVVNLSPRMMPAAFAEILAKLALNKVEIIEVVYDAVALEFRLFTTCLPSSPLTNTL